MRYRLEWHPFGRGQLLAVYDKETGLIVSSASPVDRAAVDELVRLANAGADAEHVEAGENADGRFT